VELSNYIIILTLLQFILVLYYGFSFTNVRPYLPNFFVLLLPLIIVFFASSAFRDVGINLDTIAYYDYSSIVRSYSDFIDIDAGVVKLFPVTMVLFWIGERVITGGGVILLSLVNTFLLLYLIRIIYLRSGHIGAMFFVCLFIFFYYLVYQLAIVRVFTSMLFFIIGVYFSTLSERKNKSIIFFLLSSLSHILGLILSILFIFYRLFLWNKSLVIHILAIFFVALSIEVINTFYGIGFLPEYYVNLKDNTFNGTTITARVLVEVVLIYLLYLYCISKHGKNIFLMLLFLYCSSVLAQFIIDVPSLNRLRITVFLTVIFYIGIYIAAIPAKIKNLFLSYAIFFSIYQISSIADDWNF